MIDNLIKKELKIFEILQNLFTIFIFLVHFDSSHCLYINVNTFKQYSFDVIIYYVEDDSDHTVILSLNRKTAEFLCQKIQFILFLSKLLTSAERNYWLIKIETAELIWMVCKTRYLIELTFKSNNVNCLTNLSNHNDQYQQIESMTCVCITISQSIWSRCSTLIWENSLHF